MAKNMFDKIQGNLQQSPLESEDAAQASRDRLHIKTHIRQVALEKALIEKGLLSLEDVEKQLVVVVQEVAKQVATEFGIDLEELKNQESK